MQQNEINIGIAINNAFAMPAVVTIQSLMVYESNCIVNIRVVYSELAESWIEKIESLCERFAKLRISFHRIDTRDLGSLTINRKSLSIEAYFRLFFPYLFTDVDKILWLDSDLIIQSSLKPLYDMNIEQCFAAVGQCVNDEFGQRAELKDRIGLPAEAVYFNSGVMLLNLKYWREKLERDELLKVIYKHNETKNDYDQEVLNVVFAGHFLTFDSHIYNVQLHHVFFDCHPEIVEKASIVHFTVDKPWNVRYGRRYAAVWWKYARQAGYGKEYLFWCIKHYLYICLRFCKRVVRYLWNLAREHKGR